VNTCQEKTAAITFVVAANFFAIDLSLQEKSFSEKIIPRLSTSGAPEFGSA
jgi:hypothetical protein